MENSTVGGQVKISINHIYQILAKYLNSAPFLSHADRLGRRFSKDPVSYRALRAILETMTRLLWKDTLLICFRFKERQNNC